MQLALDIPLFPIADYKYLETPSANGKLSWKPKKKVKLIVVPRRGTEHEYVSVLNYADVNKKGNNYNN